MKIIATATKSLRNIGFLALGLAATPVPESAIAGVLQVDHKPILRSTVRVVANGSTSSGFLYGNDNRSIITTLHSVLPPRGNIEIFCRGNPTNAVVKKFLKEADLVLLEAAEDLDALGCRAVDGLKVEDIPAIGSIGIDLYAFGFKPGNSRTANNRTLQKAAGDPETLEGLLPDKVVSKIRGPFIPDLRQPLYYVNGGLIPGFSGGPVFNEKGALVGIVQGGLDKGSSNHDWLVPSSAIARLLNSPEGRQLPEINPSSFGYSSPPAAESSDKFISSAPTAVVDQGAPDPQEDYPIAEDECFSEEYQHTWVMTRTRSIEELYESADPDEGIDQLLDIILPSVETAAENDLRFDIYEELCRGMVIAVPVGTELEYEEHEDGLFLVAVNAPEMTNGEALFRVGHEQFTFTLDDGTEVGPGHEDFMIEALDYYLGECEDIFENCEIDPDLFRAVEYSDGSSIMRAAVVGEDSDGTATYSYHSVVISGGELLEVQTLINLGEDSAVLKCIDEETASACGAAYWQPASFMLANLLTNITGRPVGEEPLIITGDDLAQDATSEVDPSVDTGPVPASYPDNTNWTLELVYENGAPAFQRDAEGNWWVASNDEWLPANLVSEDRESEVPIVVLQHENAYWRVPLNGGTYYAAMAGGEWIEQYPLWLR